MAKADILQPFILSWEGGYVNNPADKGGPTMKGITLTTFRSVFGKDKTVNDLKRISSQQWFTIFKKYYWDKWQGDRINDQSIANLLVDWYWGSGIYGITLPQKSLGLTSDGIVGPKTLGAINTYPDKKELFDYLWKQRQAHFKRIAKGNQLQFLKGWLNRLNGIKYSQLKCNGGGTIFF